MSLADAFAGMGRASREDNAQAPKRLRAEAPLPLQGTAKSKHPDFEAVKIYVRSKTRKQAWRKWEDEGGGDFSDLVEKLLSEYVGA